MKKFFALMFLIACSQPKQDDVLAVAKMRAKISGLQVGNSVRCTNGDLYVAKKIILTEGNRPVTEITGPDGIVNFDGTQVDFFRKLIACGAH